MYYRRKIILALIQLMGGELEKIRIQKLLFLYSQRKGLKPEYEFIPYKFGCYSYSLNADLNTMVKKGYFEEDQNTLIRTDSKNYISTLKVTDKKLLESIVSTYGSMSNNALIRHTYINFPYYATNSTIVKEVLNDIQIKKVTSAIPPNEETILYTIGYEGISLENYLNRLLKARVQVLVDVRRNPQSMKYGFTKSTLTKYCNSVGIDYIHIPEVGIQSNLRKELNTQADYDELFKIYQDTTLKEELERQDYIFKLLEDKQRIALTCFEADHCQCHRTSLAKSIHKLSNSKYKIEHL